MMKRKVIAIVAALIVLTGTVSVFVVRNMQAAAKNSKEEILTTSVMKQDVQKTLAATGTIISAEESGQFATVSGSYPVEEVYVKVGDVVKKGDPLYKLDMTSMRETLSYQKQALDIQTKQNQLSEVQAKKAFNDSLAAGAIQVNEATRNAEQAKQDRAAADRAKSAANEQLASARNAESAARSAIENAKKSGDENTDIKSLEDAYNSAVSARLAAEQQVSAANDSINSAARQLDAANNNIANTQSSAANNSYSQAIALQSNALSAQASTLSSKQEIAKSNEELSKAVVYASQDGTVTNVNVVKGQTYSGTDAIVINNVNSLKATTDIDEAQIPQIALGQKVEIKTDATGDEVLTGVVTFVSPTATKNSAKSADADSATASVSKSRATYRVDVTIDGTNENLRLGMTAKMTFVTAEAKNALVVPTSDIKLDENGDKYVVVQAPDGTTKNVTVEAGVADDFFTEIKGDSLKEGDVILESELDGSADAVIDEMGADGGIYFE
ncbi:MAG: efflux RND transporter periplasmic adaptor subunit [Pseudobutyrivibrio sp.]|nr:efflux RND transporter periplasmic adaptor subunit [Pseudobutyrivibrio sp.]